MSESFRKYEGVVRSRNPIFSVCSFGKYKKDFEYSCINDCFGENSCFGLLHSYGGKLINIACNFEVTYLHYVEQKKIFLIGILKNLMGKFWIMEKEDLLKQDILLEKKINYSMDLDKLKKKLIKENKFFVSKFGRFFFTSVSCNDFFKFSEKLLEENEYSLIKEK